MNKVVIRLSIVCSAALGVLMLARIIPAHAPWLESSMSVVAYPLIMCRHECARPINHLCSLMRARADAERARCDYQDRYERLVAQQVETVGTDATWQEIKELVMFKKRYANETALVVHIIGRHFFSDRHVFVLDAGSAKGVQIDMVAVYKNCLVGRVSEVYPYYSCVTLITDPQCKVAAFCKKALDRGIHEGCCELDKTRLTYVFDVNLDLEKRLEKGDVVISSGEGLIFPGGFGLGTIVDYQKNDVQYTIAVKPFLDFSRLEYCSLIAKGADYTGSEEYVGAVLPTTQGVVALEQKGVSAGVGFKQPAVASDVKTEPKKMLASHVIVPKVSEALIVKPVEQELKQSIEPLVPTLPSVEPVRVPEGQPVSQAPEADKNVVPESLPVEPAVTLIPAEDAADAQAAQPVSLEAPETVPDASDEVASPQDVVSADPLDQPVETRVHRRRGSRT